MKEKSLIILIYFIPIIISVLFILLHPIEDRYMQPKAKHLKTKRGNKNAKNRKCNNHID